MPVVVASEVEDSRPLDVKGNVEVVGLLVQEVAGVGPLVAPRAVVGAAHVRPRTDPLVSPAVPLAVRVKADRDYRRLLGHGPRGESKRQAEHAENGAVVWEHGNAFLSRVCS